MLFCTWTYVFFLLAVALLYWRLPHQNRIPLLLIASYVFYMAWSPPFGLIYGPVIFLDSWYFYGLGKAMLRWPQYKKAILTFGVTTELCLLAYFKYANFLYHNIEVLARSIQMPVPHLEVHVFMPLAISFTNFVLISFLVDVYRGEEKMEHGFMRFATYVAFFPHLIAGPIVRARELLHQFDQERRFDADRLVKGIHTFLLGLGLKLFVADMMAPYVDVIYSNPALQGFDTSWVATYAFAIQIFCDFWGYTLMAQGSALVMGYTLPDNFNAPYFSLNITDFWRRWHMSLSRWLRDYLYISLGGSRVGKLATYRNLFITMGLGGLWHGASWSFVIWGLYQGLLLTLHKFAVFLKLNLLLPRVLAWVLTFHMVCIGWVFFRAPSYLQAFHILQTMFTPTLIKGLLINVEGTVSTNVQLFNGINALTLFVLFLATHALIRNYGRLFNRPMIRDWAYGFAYCIFIILAITVDSHSKSFIYFQF